MQLRIPNRVALSGAAALPLVLSAGLGVGAQRESNAVDTRIRTHAAEMFERGKRIFRFDTFGDEALWGDTLRLHEAVEGAWFGGVGDGLSPAAALALGLKVDADALPPGTLAAIHLTEQDKKNLIEYLRSL